MQYDLHNKFDLNELKTPLITVAGITLKHRVDLISAMVPLEVVANNNKNKIYVLLDNFVKPYHEYKRGDAVFVEHIYVVFLSLYSLEKNCL